MADQAIRIRPGNPREGLKDVEVMAAALRTQLPNDSIKVDAELSSGYGVTAWEVLNVFVPWADLPHDALMLGVGAITKEAIAWAHRRLKKSPLRPKYIAIYGPDSRIIKAIRVEGQGVETDMTQERLDEEASWKAYQETHKTD